MPEDIESAAHERVPIILRLDFEEAMKFRALNPDDFFLVTKVHRGYNLSAGTRIKLVYLGEAGCEEWECLVVGITHSTEHKMLDNVLVSKNPDRKHANGKLWYSRV
jgi:hypothetical protein